MTRYTVIIVLLTTALLGGCQQDEYTALVSWTNIEQWDTPYGHGKRVQSRHYMIYTTVKKDRVISQFPAFMEAAYEHYHALTHLPKRTSGKPWPIYLMANREQWANLTRHELKDKAGPYLSITNGGYTHRGVGVFWWQPGAALGSVAAHEGLHQFFHYRLRHHLPMWLEEGLCTLTEGYHYKFGGYLRFTPETNHVRFNTLRKAVVNPEGTWFPLTKLLSMDAGQAVNDPDPDAGAIYYAQVWALVRFLLQHEQYRDGVYQMLADAEAGRFHGILGFPEDKFHELMLRGRAYNVTVSQALFERYFTKDLTAFEAEYRQFAEKDLAGIQWPPRKPTGMPWWHAP